MSADVVPNDAESPADAVSPTPENQDAAPEPSPDVPEETPAKTESVSGSVPVAAESSDQSPDEESGATDASREETPSEPPRRRVELRPSLGTEGIKAVPSQPASVAPAAPTPTSSRPGEPTDAEVDAVVGEGLSQAAASDAPAAAPVELPPAVDDLDADLEAQINAALASDEQAAMEKEVPPAATEESSDEPAKSEPARLAEEELVEGTRLKGKIDSIHGDNVFVDLGYRSVGTLPLRQFESAKAPKPGQEVEVVVSKVDSDEGLITVNLPTGRQRVSGDWDSVWKGQVVDCMVTKTNKGGLEVKVSSLRGFMPAGQVDLHYVDDLEPFVGQKLTAKVIEANRQKRNLVVSRRAYLEAERKEAEEALWFTIEEGKKFIGTVKTIKEYGAFIDLGGVDGFLHIGEISWTHIKHPSEVLQQGQQVDVVVLSLDHEKRKISLGMKQLVQNPWATAEDKYAKGRTVSGRVTRVTNFGAFVELEPGVEGLVHISELDYKRVKRVTDVLNVDDTVDVQVLELDMRRKRIALSVKALKPKPESPEDARDADSADGTAPVARKRKGPLKGGIGNTRSGQMFGDPKDFG